MASNSKNVPAITPKAKNSNRGLKNRNKQNVAATPEMISNLSAHLQKVTLSNEKKNHLLQQIIEKNLARVRQDITSWRNALQAAENSERPRRQKLYQLYADVTLDNHLSGLEEHSIKDAILAETFEIVDAGDQVNEEMTLLFNNEWFWELTKHAADSVSQGHSLCQLLVEESGITVECFPRMNVRPETGEILINIADEKGIPYRGTPLMDYLIEIGGKKTLGYYSKAAKSTIFKKNAEMCWSEFCEKFGMPLTVGKTNSRKPEDLDRLQQAMEQFGSAAWAIIQEEETIELKESSRGDSYNVYDRMIERQNSELSKLVLGNTGTTDMGKNGSRSQAEVHERVSDGVLEAYKRLQTATAKKALACLQAQGFKTEGLRLRHKTYKDIDGMWKRTYEALRYFHIEPEWIKETFGIEVIGERETPAAPEGDGEKKKQLS